ncbi:hypothetical protein SERLA73DRAFT_148036, partial [Serpula lacrymans var. lacrymans S7.3]
MQESNALIKWSLPGFQKAQSNLPILDPLPASNEPYLRSYSWGISVGVTFESYLDNSVEIFWIDFTGQRKLYKTLSLGKTFEVSTYVGHPWLVYNTSNQLSMAIFYPVARYAQVAI